MDVPGLSIFQGGESIQINNSNNRLEEEEALEDQKRRNEELGNQLQNAFDDLIDDEDCTLNSSSQLQSRLLNGHCQNKNFHNRIQEKPNNNEQNLEQYFEEMEKLNKLIASKNGELETITKIVHEERKKNDELKKRFTLSEAEKTRSQMTKQQTHELLVESKAKCSELEDSIDKLKMKNKALEEEKNKLVCDLECTRTMLSDSQHKLNMIEKNQGYSADRHAENIIKQITDRHNAQIELMQQQIDNLRNKLDGKEAELKTLDTRYNELQRNREALLIDKGETINQLSKNLEESQKQCQVLMCKQDFTQENIQLKRLNSALDRQVEDMQKTINNLTARLEATTSELDLLDTVMHENTNPNVGTPRLLTLNKKANLIGSTPFSSNDRLVNLKNEIYRSATSLKEKREQIRNLEEKLHEKDDEIKNLKDEENKSLVKISTYKEENSRLENRLKLLEEEINEFKNNNNEEKVIELQEKVSSIKAKNELLEKNLEQLQEEYDLLKSKNRNCDIDERKKIDLNLKNLNIDLEELTQEHDSLKLNYEQLTTQNEQLKREKSLDPLKLELEKHKFLLKDAQKECDRIKNLYIEISNAKEAISIELAQLKSSDLHQKLQEYKTQSANFERALQLAELKSNELMKLLEIEKTERDREVNELREKIAEEKIERLKTSPKNQSMTCSKCIQQLSEITKFETQNIRLENQCRLYYKEISNLRSQVKESKNLITELSEKLSLKVDQEKLIFDLKEKATKFEEYIKNQKHKSPISSTASTSGISSPPFSGKLNQSKGNNFDPQEVETNIRNEMAKIFATELKNREDFFKKHVTEFEERNSQLRNDLIEVSNALKQRQNEVELLKHAILTEREKMNEILDQKKIDTRTKDSKLSIKLNKFQQELNFKQERIDQLLNELKEQNEQIKEERRSMKILRGQWEENRSNIEQNESEWQKMISDLRTEHTQALTVLRAKYESAKKVAINYKRYSEDKDVFVKQELERIKNEYQLNHTKLDNSYKANLEKKVNELRSEYRELYEERIKRLEQKKCKCKNDS